MFTTIKRKLYLGFGSIIAIIVVVYLVDIAVEARKDAARRHAASARGSAEDLEHVQAQISVIRLGLAEYLLTGDPRQQAKVSIEIAGLSRLFDDARPRRRPTFFATFSRAWKPPSGAGRTSSRGR